MIKFNDEKGIIQPLGENYGIDTAVAAFSTFIFDELMAYTHAEKIGVITGGVDTPLYAFERDGKRIMLYKSPVGAPAAAMALEEVGACGVKNFVLFGICGALTTVPPRTFIVPDRAFRDEGTSYHYIAAFDYITVKNSGVVDGALKAFGINTLVGGAWSTDGFYRETRSKMETLKRDGCVGVDMECAALQAVCDFRGYNFYTFFITADSLAGGEWEPNDILSLSVTSADKQAVAAAVALAAKIG